MEPLQTFESVKVHHNTDPKGGAHGERESYVNITRAKLDVQMYTQNSEKAAIQSGVSMNKEAAHAPGQDKDIKTDGHNSGKEHTNPYIKPQSEAIRDRDFGRGD